MQVEITDNGLLFTIIENNKISNKKKGKYLEIVKNPNKYYQYVKKEDIITIKEMYSSQYNYDNFLLYLDDCRDKCYFNRNQYKTRNYILDFISKQIKNL